MRGLWKRVWQDDRGNVVIYDWALVVTILVLGAITGAVLTQQSQFLPGEEPSALVR